MREDLNPGANDISPKEKIKKPNQTVKNENLKI
jgi:hypothetical protein